MVQTREIKRRIRSVEDTQQITRAMKMVAAAKLNRAQQRMEAMRPYADHLETVLDRLVFDMFGDEHFLFFPREEKTVATIVVAGDKGLCGGFNSNIIRKAKEHFESLPGVEHHVWSIGKRATSAIRKMDVNLVHHYTDVFDDLSYLFADDVCEQLMDRFLAKKIDAAYVVYNDFVSVVTQKPTVFKLLPIDFDEMLEERRAHIEKRRKDGDEDDRRLVYEIEPRPETVMEKLVGRLVATRVYRAVIESYAAELGARMSAMDAATKNADDMIQNLTMEYNRARQTAITSELLDIVGGAAGLSG